MDPFHFACPHCSSRLRVREKLFVGRQVDCPECGQSLLIVEQKGELDVRPIERKAQPATDAPENQPGKLRGKHELSGQSAPTVDSSAPNGKALQPPSPVVAGPAGSTPAHSIQGTSTAGTSTLGAGPVVAASAVESQLPITSRRRTRILAGGALCLALGLIAIAFYATPSGTNSGGDGLPNEPAVVAADAPGERPGERPGQKVVGNALPDAADPAQVEPPPDEVELRPAKLGRILLEHLAAEQTFPAGTVPILGIIPENRLSWMAVLADRLDDSAVHPVWDRPWNAHQNEAFVRRRLTMFQNPAIAELTGSDGYPAAHFVGVTGVGADAAKLENSHARAGIFGNERRTRIDDIRDGASHTLLVLGVRDQLGSWAAGGQSTMRGISREPYINGPDGFGTGSPDSMQVLLADGRVMTVNAKIDPRILRRMASKADGLPLDESEAGEPGDRRSLLAGEGAADDDDDDKESRNLELSDDKRPLDPEFAAEPALPAVKKIDLAVSLKQPIVRFDQPKSRPLSEVLTGVAEMAGARIDFDREELGPAAARLAEPVALKLDNTTVEDILTGLLRPVGLAFRVEGDHLKLVLRGQE